LSSLFPAFNAPSDSSDTAMRTSKETFDDLDSSSPTIPYSELSAWVNLHMSMNDTLYPVAGSPGFAPALLGPHSPRDSLEAEALGGKDGAVTAAAVVGPKPQNPARVMSAIGSLSRYKPTIIQGSTSTVMHLVGSYVTQKSSFRKMKSMSFDKSEAAAASLLSAPSGERDRDGDRDKGGIRPSALLRQAHGAGGGGGGSGSGGEHVMSDGESEKSSPLDKAGRPRNFSVLSEADYDGLGNLDDFNRSGPMEEAEHALQRLNSSFLARPDIMLPPLYLNNCVRSKMYLISPYHSVTINGCSDCEIIIGAVFGAVIISDCERVTITCACRKLLILNCLDCAFNIATLSATIIAGDTRGIVVGTFLIFLFHTLCIFLFMFFCVCFAFCCAMVVCP
jgi:hypothetical protein